MCNSCVYFLKLFAKLAQVATLLTCIWEVPDLNHGQGASTILAEIL
jgi:hypothetical protein